MADISESVTSAITTRSSNAIFEIAVPQRSQQFWKTGKPEFVSDYGTDQYGAWFEFQVPRADGEGVVTQRMRWIRPGTFLMGSPKEEHDHEETETQHEVTLATGYWLADTACTQEHWKAVTGEEPSHFPGTKCPVESVSHADVLDFLSVLGERVPGLEPVLPTEAQWEYACRAGTTGPFSFGDSISTDEVNFDGNHPYGQPAKGEYRQETVDVKDLPANPCGLYQMHGNVWEWCADWYAEYSADPAVDPVGPASGSDRVVRGGSWSSDARNVRSACRFWDGPGIRYNVLGFRLLSSASPDPPSRTE